MKKISIDQKVFEVLPTYQVGLVVVKGVNNTHAIEAVTKRLEAAVQHTHEALQGKNIRELDNIKQFREAFQQLGMNPNKFMCSIEALYKRVQKQAQLPIINPIVDLGNAISLEHQLPMGAHRLDRVEEALEIRFSTAEDTFLPMGATEVEALPEGELVYVSGNTVKTRRWIWRQSEDGKITDEVSDVVFPIDGFETDKVTAAQEALATAIEEIFGLPATVGIIHKEHAEFVIE